MNLICRAINFWLKWQSDLLLAKTGKNMKAMDMVLPKPKVNCEWGYTNKPDKPPGKPDKPPGKPPKP